jgi:hypothetical protein
VTSSLDSAKSGFAADKGLCRQFFRSIIDPVDIESAGYAGVDGFYRFPSFEPCEGERCQRGYSAFNMKRNNRNAHNLSRLS